MRTDGRINIVRRHDTATDIQGTQSEACRAIPVAEIDVRYAVHKYRLRMRGVPIGRPRRGGDGFGPWRFRLGKPVPVGPSPHHLVGAKEFPPSDKTHLYPKD